MTFDDSFSLLVEFERQTDRQLNDLLRSLGLMLVCVSLLMSYLVRSISDEQTQTNINEHLQTKKWGGGEGDVTAIMNEHRQTNAVRPCVGSLTLTVNGCLYSFVIVMCGLSLQWKLAELTGMVDRPTS